MFHCLSLKGGGRSDEGQHLLSVDSVPGLGLSILHIPSHLILIGSLRVVVFLFLELYCIHRGEMYIMEEAAFYFMILL